jgi:glycosyltransferase involved in cell wall biosynthesis
MSINGYDIGVVIPAYNEGDRIEHTIRTLYLLHYIDRILVVDDGSLDNTAFIAAEAGADVLSLTQNKGKAYAMKKGYETMHTHILVFLDGDIGEGADQITSLVKPICEGKAAATIARFPMTPGKGGFGLVKALAAWGLQVLTGSSLSSVLSGQRAFLHNVLSSDFF